MKTLEYHETILKKVSFDKRLLRMELKKAVRNTICSEQPAFLEWCREHLGEEYKKMAADFMENNSCAFEDNDNQ